MSNMRKIAVLLFCLVLLSACSTNPSNEQQWEPHDIDPINDVTTLTEDDSCTIDCEYPIQENLIETDIADFRLGMDRDEILKKIGRPHSPYGSGFWIDAYKIDELNALFYYIQDDDTVILDSLVICSSTECKKLK